MILSLFFTRGVSLDTWVKQGLFDREKLLYEEHLKQGNLSKIYWFTYGSNDKEISKQLKLDGKLAQNIEIYEMPTIFNIPKIGNLLYSLIIPFYYRKIIKKSNILKSNQMDGSWSAFISKQIYKIPFINRTGYTLSIFTKRQNTSILKQYIIEKIERIVYSDSDANVVASNQDKKYLINKYNINKNNIHVIHNYIDTNLFKPMDMKRNNKIIFVGRLTKQKNLFNLIKAISNTDLELDIYGQGELKEELMNFSNKISSKVYFKGIVNNKELPYVLNQYKYYILSSHYEGMPKTLLEAMACGCTSIGTDVDGINEVIMNERNGYLSVDTTIDNIVKSIKKAKERNNINIIENAIITIEKFHSLDSVTLAEKEIFRVINV